MIVRNVDRCLKMDHFYLPKLNGPPKMGSYDHFFQRDSFFRHLAPEIYKVPTHTHICSKTPFFHSSSSNFFFGQSRKNNQTGASGPDDVSPTEMERERERERKVFEKSLTTNTLNVFFLLLHVCDIDRFRRRWWRWWWKPSHVCTS